MLATSDVDVRHVRSAARALLRQLGGTMIVQLRACGAVVRMECSLQSGAALFMARSSSEEGAMVVIRSKPGVDAECSRAGCTLQRLEASVPSSSIPVPLTRAA
jgi:hypothetical protein